MRQKKTLNIVLLTVLLISMQAISFAAATQIEFKTLPNSYLTVRILEPGEKYASLQTFTNVETGSSGTVTIDYSADMSKVDVEAYLKFAKNGPTQFFHKYESISTKDATLNLPEKEEGTVSQTQTETLEDATIENATTEEVTEEKTTTATATQTEETTLPTETAETTDTAGVTGEVISQPASDSKKVNPMIYYIIGGILVAGLFIAGTRYMKMPGRGPAHPPTNHDPSPPKTSSSFSLKSIMPAASPTTDSPSYEDNEIKAAEEKLNAAQNELGKIKKMRELEGRIKQDQDELNRLKQ